jgi:photosystem II CP47 chlorophyll apoprotein
VHIIHSGLAAGWSGVMVLYELITFDPTDPVYNPSWRQGCYVIPFISRIGVISSLYSWSLGIKLRLHVLWTYETINASHIEFSGLLILAAFWHWAYWDLNVFAHLLPGSCLLDLNKILGIHLFFSSLVCFGFGYGHLSGFSGPGIWTEDSIGVLGSIRFVKPIYSLHPWPYSLHPWPYSLPFAFVFA